ncbi:MAG: hypothetical protein WAT39_15900 [Planctomycetota bacterium]
MHHPISVHVLPTFLATLVATMLPAQQAASPSDRLGLEGSSFTHFPLGRANARMQTLHADIPGGTVLTGHGYRRDAITVRGQVDGFTCDLEVRASISPNLPTQASTTFANNAGPNPVVVLPRQLVTFPPTQRPLIDPAGSFELTIPWTTPFALPLGGGTLCLDVEIWGNSSAAGSNVNLSVYLDAHENYPDGRAEQPGFRTGNGCPAPGSVDDSYATMTYWRLTTGGRLDVSIRDGVPDSGNGLSRPFVTIGHSLAGSPWPLRPDCPFWSSSEVWFPLPGTMNSAGDYDGSLAALPLLPPGYRLWCQAGSIDLGTVGMAFSDAVTFVTPPAGPVPIPTVRIVNSTNHAAATGTVSYAVPVIAFL